MATYYVDGVDGNDLNAGTSEGSGNAWATIDKAMNTVAAGDHVYIKGNGDYTETATIDTVGTQTASIIFEGYTSTPGDGGMATIDATGLSNGVTYSVSPYLYYVFRNITVKNANSYGWSLSACRLMAFENCQANNNAGWGFNLSGYAVFMEWEAKDNTANGGFRCIDHGRLIGCKIMRNSGIWVLLSSSSSFLALCLSVSFSSFSFYFRLRPFSITTYLDGDAHTTPGRFALHR